MNRPKRQIVQIEEARDFSLTDRVPRACSNCRSSKLKCDIQRPCSRCVNQGQGHLCCVDHNPVPRPKPSTPTIPPVSEDSLRIKPQKRQKTKAAVQNDVQSNQFVSLTAAPVTVVLNTDVNSAPTPQTSQQFAFAPALVGFSTHSALLLPPSSTTSHFITSSHPTIQNDLVPSTVHFSTPFQHTPQQNSIPQRHSQQVPSPQSLSLQSQQHLATSPASTTKTDLVSEGSIPPLTPSARTTPSSPDDATKASNQTQTSNNPLQPLHTQPAHTQQCRHKSQPCSQQPNQSTNHLCSQQANQLHTNLSPASPAIKPATPNKASASQQSFAPHFQPMSAQLATATHFGNTTTPPSPFPSNLILKPSPTHYSNTLQSNLQPTKVTAHGIAPTLCISGNTALFPNPVKTSSQTTYNPILFSNITSGNNINNHTNHTNFVTNNSANQPRNLPPTSFRSAPLPPHTSSLLATASIFAPDIQPFSLQLNQFQHLQPIPTPSSFAQKSHQQLVHHGFQPTQAPSVSALASIPLKPSQQQFQQQAHLLNRNPNQDTTISNRASLPTSSDSKTTCFPPSPQSSKFHSNATVSPHLSSVHVPSSNTNYSLPNGHYIINYTNQTSNVNLMNNPNTQINQNNPLAYLPATATAVLHPSSQQSHHIQQQHAQPGLLYFIPLNQSFEPQLQPDSQSNHHQLAPSSCPRVVTACTKPTHKPAIAAKVAPRNKPSGVVDFQDEYDHNDNHSKSRRCANRVNSRTSVAARNTPRRATRSQLADLPPEHITQQDINTTSY